MKISVVVPAFNEEKSLEAIIAKTLTKNPADRYQNLGELISDLELVKRGGTPTVTVMRAADKRSSKGVLSDKLRWIIPLCGIVVLAAVAIILFMPSLRLVSAKP